MLVASHQPHFMPWLRYLHKIHMADVFIFSDDVQYRKGWFQNRNKIIDTSPSASSPWRWLTAPISETPSDAKIKNVRLAKSSWRQYHLNLLGSMYKDAPYFDWTMDHVVRLYETDTESLSDLSIESCLLLARLCGVSIGHTVKASGIPYGPPPTLASGSLRWPGVSVALLT